MGVCSASLVFLFLVSIAIFVTLLGIVVLVRVNAQGKAEETDEAYLRETSRKVRSMQASPSPASPTSATPAAPSTSRSAPNGHDEVAPPNESSENVKGDAESETEQK